MLDRPSYRQKWEDKLAWYRAHDVLPFEEGGGANGMLVTSEDSPRTGIDSQAIERLAKSALGLG